MKVIALVSGGKDSCYNMVMCEQYGHQIVALGNLLPEAAETDDLDSYMYQTVGHQVIAAYARCCGLPLFRRRIQGSSQQQALVYEETEGDEVEDLHALLAFVKERMPEVQAVASGAIASDYQRTRVERVCARLGLVSLAYLWQQPQALLLQRMIDSQIDAILVKIAAAGLTPTRHLGATLASLPQQLAKLRRQYGCNVCGEGGEYESLTLDCPLFKHGSIVLDAWDTVIVSPDRLAPVALLRPTAFHMEPKGPPAGAGEGQAADVIEVAPDYTPPQAAGPPPVRSDASVSCGGSSSIPVSLFTTAGSEYVTVTAEVPRRPPLFPCASGSAEQHPAQGAAAAAAGPSDVGGSTGGVEPGSPAATAAALCAALHTLGKALPPLGLTWHSALFVHLYVPSMAHFGSANEAYSTFFPPVNPPSRATVEIGSNPQLALVVEVLFARQPEGRRVLHVQSISQWAPSCIGPYSQALTHRGLVLMAGQIALDPPTMAMVGGGLDAQCMRVLRSCQAVAVAMRTDLPRSMLWCTIYCSGAAGAEGTRRAARHLSTFLAGQELASGEAVVDQSSGGGSTEAGGKGAAAGQGVPKEGSDSSGHKSADYSEGDSGDESELELDDYLLPPPMQRQWGPLLTYVVVPELPRGGLVEIQPVACVVDSSIAAVSPSSSSSDSDEEGSQGASDKTGTAQRGSMPGWIGRLEERQQTFVAADEGGWPSQNQVAAAAAEAMGDLSLSGIACEREKLGGCSDPGHGGQEGGAGPGALLLRCRELSSKGRMCRAHISLAWGSPAPGQPCKVALTEGTAPPWQLATAQQLLGALRHAELAPEDVASVKVYCPARQGGAVAAGKALLGVLGRELGAGVQAALVPVEAVGGWGDDGDVGDLLAVELLALRG